MLLDIMGSWIDLLRAYMEISLQIPMFDHLSAPQLIYEVLVREVTFSGARYDEMWFEIGSIPYRCGKREFILISGLRFGKIEKKRFETRPIESGSLRAHMFP